MSSTVPDGWRPTHAHLRAVAIALICVFAATFGGRADIAVLGVPFLALAALGERHRPRTGVACTLRTEARTLFEGQSTTATVAIAAVDDAERPGDIVAAALETGPWFDSTPPAGSAVVGGAGSVEIALPSAPCAGGATRWPCAGPPARRGSAPTGPRPHRPARWR